MRSDCWKGYDGLRTQGINAYIWGIGPFKTETDVQAIDNRKHGFDNFNNITYHFWTNFLVDEN
ncbi:MAG: hypothetical protein GYB55_05820 [Cytophagales bacterium]|nr:hypothetical protein [Algoriphagus iocasae]MBB6325364.1 hypothetical protein [Algoriphagus iocasae]MBR9774537.1 hypothetical protein [Cytophagales bacterium]PTB95626.1 hypothetical protein C9994_10895 [Marivirga lumbricoides]|tara:strand:- start:5834 stop:6022 length:189 start_codon:yes stop_codon:yes gene_type:complete